jgi:hypothetical protein
LEGKAHCAPNHEWEGGILAVDGQAESRKPLLTLHEAEHGQGVAVRVHCPHKLGPIVVDDGRREPVEDVAAKQEEDVRDKPAVEACGNVTYPRPLD